MLSGGGGLPEGTLDGRELFGVAVDAVVADGMRAPDYTTMRASSGQASLGASGAQLSAKCVARNVSAAPPTRQARALCAAPLAAGFSQHERNDACKPVQQIAAQSARPVSLRQLVAKGFAASGMSSDEYKLAVARAALGCDSCRGEAGESLHQRGSQPMAQSSASLDEGELSLSRGAAVAQERVRSMFQVRESLAVPRQQRVPLDAQPTINPEDFFRPASPQPPVAALSLPSSNAAGNSCSPQLVAAPPAPEPPCDASGLLPEATPPADATPARRSGGRQRRGARRARQSANTATVQASQRVPI